MTDAEFRAMFLAAVAACDSRSRREAAARFCQLWSRYRRWVRRHYLPSLPPGRRWPDDEARIVSRPMVLKARALGFEHTVGAVLTMAQKCGHDSSSAPAGSCACGAPPRQRGRESAPRRSPADDDDTLSL